MAGGRGGWYHISPDIGMNSDVIKLFHDFVNMVAIAFEATLIAPAILQFFTGVAKDGNEVWSDRYSVLKVSFQLFHADLSNVRPYTKDIGEVGDVDGLHDFGEVGSKQ